MLRFLWRVVKAVTLFVLLVVVLAWAKPGAQLFQLLVLFALWGGVCLVLGQLLKERKS